MKSEERGVPFFAIHSAFCIHHSAFIKRRRLRAFTLVEILIVVVILGGLALLVLPALASRDDLNANAAARMVTSDLLFAQGRAIATGTMQYVSFAVGSSGSSSGYAIYGSKPFTSPVTNPVTQNPYTVTFGAGSAGVLNSTNLPGVNFDAAANKVLAFNELGQPYVCTASSTPTALAATGVITIQCNSQTVAISVEPDTGNITLP